MGEVARRKMDGDGGERERFKVLDGFCGRRGETTEKRKRKTKRKAIRRYGQWGGPCAGVRNCDTKKIVRRNVSIVFAFTRTNLKLGSLL